MGELANFKGLKFRRIFKILFAIWGRARINMEREFKVASTSTALLGMLVSKEWKRSCRYGRHTWNSLERHSKVYREGLTLRLRDFGGGEVCDLEVP